MFDGAFRKYLLITTGVILGGCQSSPLREMGEAPPVKQDVAVTKKEVVATKKEVASTAAPETPAASRTLSETGSGKWQRTSRPAERAGAIRPASAEEVAVPGIPPTPAAEGEKSPEKVDGPSAKEGVAEEGLSLQQVEQLALENNPTLRQAAWLVESARGRWLQVGLYPNPVGGYTSSEIGNDGAAGQQGAFIGQTFVTANKLGWNRRIAARDIDRFSWQAEMQRLRVLNDIRIQFYEALGAQQMVKLAEQLQKIAQEGVNIARQLKEAKQAPQTDVLQAEVDLQTIQLLLVNARQRKAAALRRLAALAGVPVLPDEDLSGSLQSEAPVIEREAAWMKVVSSNPVLQAAMVNVQRARARLQRERVQPVPDINTQFGAAYDFSSDFTIFSVQLGVMWPLYNRNQGNISAAAAQLHQAAENVQRMELLLKRRFADVYLRYETSRSRVEAYRGRILKKAFETLRLTTEAAKGGQLDLLRVLTARRSYFQLEMRAIEAEIELQKARAELEGLLLTGGLMHPANVSISSGGSGGSGGGGGAGGAAAGGISTVPLTVTPKAQ